VLAFAGSTEATEAAAVAQRATTRLVSRGVGSRRVAEARPS
jgi:hypothetical protein